MTRSTNLNIITSGRLASEFEQYANTFEGVNCTYVEDLSLTNSNISEFDAYAGFGSELNSIDISGLIWIHSFGAGIDAFINHPYLNHETLISRTTGELGNKIAEYCLAYSLMALKRIHELKNNQHHKIWAQLEIRNLRDQNILIYGTGFVGASIAKVLRPLARKIAGINSTGNPSSSFHQIYKESMSLAELEQFNIVINALPLTSKTENFFDRNVFSGFKNVIFINVGRGKSVVTKHLEEALTNQNVDYAILDVFEAEPLTLSHPFWKNDKVTITPHQAGITTIGEIKDSFKSALLNFLEDKNNICFTGKNKGY